MADTATGMYIEPERRLTVRTGRHEVVLAASAEEEGAEAGHDIAALVFEGMGGMDMKTSSVNRATNASRSADFVRADRLGHERFLSRRLGNWWRLTVTARRLTAVGWPGLA